MRGVQTEEMHDPEAAKVEPRQEESKPFIYKCPSCGEDLLSSFATDTDGKRRCPFCNAEHQVPPVPPSASNSDSSEGRRELRQEEATPSFMDPSNSPILKWLSYSPLDSAQKDSNASKEGEEMEPCPCCGQRISSLAHSCPHCGRPFDSLEWTNRASGPNPFFLRTLFVSSIKIAALAGFLFWWFAHLRDYRGTFEDCAIVLLVLILSEISKHK
ncbi:MAG: hypothetical protein IJS08_11695 [Victivallales bacterium]|nr:hypothetical protein [Victivallales bacterium]